MTDKITYYAIVDEDTSREQPRTVLRRVQNEEGQTDEIFSRDLTWERSPLLHAVNRGDTMLDVIEIDKEDADRIVARIRSQADAGE
jgi:CBS-domain-containing membrane protein